MRNAFLICLTLGFALILGLNATPGFCVARPNSLNVKPLDSRIARLYVAMLDRDIERALPALTSSNLLPAQWPKDASGVEIDPISMQLPKSNALRTAELTCALSHAYRIPDSSWFENPQALDRILKMIRTLIPGDEKDLSIAGFSVNDSEFLLYLEPLLVVNSLISEQFPTQERSNLRAWIDSAIGVLYQSPLRLQNEIGMHWCAVMAIASRVTDDPKYRESADRAFEWMSPLVGESGEYVDPLGLDLKRAHRFVRSLFLYRYYGGRDDLDERIIRCLRWYSRLYTSSGIPLLGVREPLGVRYRTLFAQCLGPLAYYAEREPPFAQTVTRFMERIMDASAGYALESGATSFLLASSYHRIPQLDALPNTPYTQVCNGNLNAAYALIGRNYRTAVVIRDPSIPKGLQSWSYRDGAPLVFPAPPRYSKTVGFGYDSSTLNAGNELAVASTIHAVTDWIDVLVVPHEIPTAYVFSKDAVVVVHRQPYEDAVLEWIQDYGVCAALNNLSGSTINFKDSPAVLSLLPDSIPNYEEFEGGARLRLHFKSEFCWYTFAGPDANTIVRPIHSGLIFVHVRESDRSINFAINLSPDLYDLGLPFPGTTVPIPNLSPWSAKIIRTK